MSSRERLTRIQQPPDLIISGQIFFVWHVKSRSLKGKAAMGFRQTEDWCGWWRVQGNHANARKSWTCLWEQLCLVMSRITDAVKFVANPTSRRSKCACIVEPHESLRERLEETPSKKHEGHIVEKGFNSVSHENLVHKYVPLAPCSGNSGWESCCWQRVGEARKVATMAIDWPIVRSTKAGSYSEVTLWKMTQVHHAAFTEEGSVCISTDGRKSDGCHCKVTGICRTNSRHSSPLTLRENGTCSKKWSNFRI